jgi:urease accessory protein
MVNAHNTPGWRAELELRAVRSGSQTVLQRSRHVGPLRVQRPFMEASGACQVYILHPPGGIVGGDTLDVQVYAARDSNVLLTTPGSGKFYRSTGQLARQTHRLVVESGASIEWLPQETIVFDGAVAASEARIELTGNAKVIWWEVTCLGRPASNEQFTRGTFSQNLELLYDGRPQLLDRTRCRGAEPALGAHWGYQGLPVFGTLVAHPVALELLPHVRTLLNAHSVSGEQHLGVTLLPHHSTPNAVAATFATLVCRYLGPSAAQAKHVFTSLWELLRPRVVGLNAEAPRVWQT